MTLKIFGKYSYSRGRSMLNTGEIIKLIDYEGNFNIFKIGRKESLGNMMVQLTKSGVSGNIVPGAASEFTEYRFVEPAQENRLFQFRPELFAVRRIDGRLLYAAIPDIPVTPANAPPPAPDTIPMGVSLQVKHPGGTWRWGTDVKRDVQVTTPGGVVITTPGVGGVDGGYLEAPLAPLIDDPSSLWDLFTLFGHTFEFRIINRTNFFWPPGFDIGGASDNKDYFVSLNGARYLLVDVSEAIKEKVLNREIDYDPVVIGGIPTVTTKA
jgi:hypothetical protein